MSTAARRDLPSGRSASRGLGRRTDAAPRRAWTLARGLGLVVALLLPLLAGCAVVDPLERQICLSVLPAVEAPEARLTVVSVDLDPDRPADVRVTYRAEVPDRRVAVRRLVCAFGLDAVSGDTRALLGVLTPEGEMSGARLHILKRFWLGDPATVADAVARIRIDPGAEPRGLLTLAPGPAVLLQAVVDAAAPAALHALLAVACALIWGLVGRIVFALGDIAMLGAWGALIGAVSVEAGGEAAAGPLIAVALLVAVAVGGAWGGVIGRVVYAPLAFRAVQPLLVATVGLSIALQEFVARSQGARDRFLAPLLNTPRLVADGPFTVTVTPMRLLAVTLPLAVVGLVLTVFPRSRFGRAWRAVADDAVMARLLGLDPNRILIATFVLASGLAAVAGAVLTLAWGGTSFHMGTVLGLEAAVAAVVGGIGSLPGAALAGLLVGVVEVAWSTAFGIEWRDVAVLSLLIVLLLVRPDGLMGRGDASRSRDSAP